MADHERAGGGVSEGSPHQLTITSASALSYLETIHHDLLKEHGHLSTFLKHTQKEDETVCSAYKDQRPGQSPFQTFLHYLGSADGSLVRLKANQDLTHPLSNYFISSSHNTYLTGNQLSSDSSTSGSSREAVDVWRLMSGNDDSSSDEEQDSRSFKARIKQRLGSQDVVPKVPAPKEIKKRVEPRVLHGYTLTKEISFREVCESIRDNAFLHSDLPVIVSLEVHTSLEQQLIMVEIIRETWDGLLINLTSATQSEVDALPPPSDLRRKILIKVKYTAPEKAEKKAKEEETEVTRVDTVSSDEASVTSKGEKKKKKMLDSLSTLGIYTRSHHFRNFEQPEAELPSHVFSLSEGAVSNAHENNGAALFKHNQRFFMRTYPRGTRISSSNLNPALFWRQGIQMVALNWQKCDKGVMLNEGMFANTGGWVLKPKGFRSEDNPSHKAEIRVLDLTIEFLAAQDIPLPPSEDSERGFKPYVKVTLHTETLGTAPPSTIKRTRERSRSFKSDKALSKRAKVKQTTVSATSKSELKGQTKSHRGCSPDYKGERIIFSSIPIDDEELSFVRFKIEDDIDFRPDEMAAWACARMDRLKEGLRIVRLFDTAGKPTDGFLLLKITKSYHAEAHRVDSLTVPIR